MYNEEYHCKLVYRLALLNLSEREMTVALDCSEYTLELWKKTHPPFIRALRRGRDEADAKVARALFRRAVGWGTYDEEVVSRKVKNADGSERVETVTVPKRKRYPPDVAAISLWLRNRQPQRWRTGDSDSVAVSAVNVSVDLSSLSTEDLRLARRLGVAAVRTDSSETLTPAGALLRSSGNGDSET